jgi:hypothetical protein
VPTAAPAAAFSVTEKSAVGSAVGASFTSVTVKEALSGTVLAPSEAVRARV